MPNLLTAQLAALKTKYLSEDSGRALLGSPNQAKIVIFDRRKVGAAAGSQPAVSAAAAKAIAAAKAPAASSAPPLGVERVFSVQFNPSSLSVYATTLEIGKRNTLRSPEDGTQHEHTDSVIAPTVEMSVDLIFDHVEVSDAFMADKLRLGLVNTVAAAASAIANKGKKVNTVKKEVEGLIAALRDNRTRSVAFVWADFVFRGKLKSVNADYTMFSTSGRPIRAKVSLRLMQTQTEVSRASWQKEFEEAFGAAAAASWADKARAATNVINIGL